MDFAENLKRICDEKGTTPTALCKELGLSTSKVSAWYGGSLPKQDVMVKLAKKLDCSVMDFFYDGEDDTQLLIEVMPKRKDEDLEDILRIPNCLVGISTISCQWFMSSRSEVVITSESCNICSILKSQSA